MGTVANAFQAFNDSAAGVVLGTTMHTLGAIGLLGGLVGYMAWHRHLRRGHHHANVLAGATFLTYFAIVVNLAGGFMRTYETGHPHITEFSTSAWVRAISIKHLFLFAGMGAAVYLFEVVAPRHLKALREQTLHTVPSTGHTLGILLVILGIVVAAVLGAVSSTLPVGATPMDDSGSAPLVDAYHNATGQLLGTPLAPAVAGADFVVPANRTGIGITLTWTPAQSNVRFELLDPQGQVRFDRTAATGTLDAALDEVPEAGTWSYRLSSPDAVINAQWTLSLHLAVTAEHGH